MKKIPVYWGNREWLINDVGVLVPSTPLEETDLNWIDYTKVACSQSADLAVEGHPHSALRLQLRKQIREATLKGAEKFIEENPVCILTHGGIASGKTSAIELFLNLNDKHRDRYLHLDFDLMKKQIPEYVFMHSNRIKFAADFTRVESGSLAATTFKKAIKQKMSVIYEGSLVETKAIRERIAEMRTNGFEIILVSTHVTEQKGQERAIKRFESGGRFVSPETIKRTYDNCPRTLVELLRLVDLMVLTDNELDGQPGRIILKASAGIKTYEDKGLYNQYLQCVGPAGNLESALQK